MSSANDALRFPERNKRFRLWLVRGGVAIACLLVVLAAWYLHQVQRQHAAAEELRQRGVYLIYEPLNDEGNGIAEDRPPWLRDVVENDWLGSPRAANAHACFHRIDNRALACLGNLRRLKGLDLTRARISGEGLDSLSALRNLRYLNLSGTSIGDDDLKRLQKLPRLTTLGLAYTPVSDAGIDELSRLRLLKNIDLRETLVTAEGLARLEAALPDLKIAWRRSPTPEHGRACAAIMRGGGSFITGKRSSDGFFVFISDDTYLKYDEHQWRGNVDDLRALPEIQGLRGLSVNPDFLGPDKWALLAACPDLDTLYLPNGNISDDELSHLFGIPRLSRLSITRCPISDHGLMHIGNLSRLVSLGLERTAVSDQGLVALEGLTRLESLNLGQTNVTDAGMSSVAKLPALNFLTLTTTKVGDEGLAQLSQLTNLENLRLRHTQVTDAGLVHLYGLSQLKHIDLYGNPGVSQAGIDRLKAAIPGIHVSGSR